MLPEDSLQYIHRVHHVPKEMDGSNTELAWENVIAGLQELGLTVDSTNRLHLGGQNRFRYLNSMASLTRTTTQTISTGTVTALAFDAEEVDTDTLHDNSTNNSRVTIALTGKYFVFGQVDYEASSTGQRQARIHKNGSEFLTSIVDSSTAGIVIVQVATVMSLSSGDYVELATYQDSGGDLLANANIANAPTTRFAVVYLGE